MRGGEGDKKESCSRPSAPRRLCRLGWAKGDAQTPHRDGAAGGIDASCSLRGLQAQPLSDGFTSALAAPGPGDVAGVSSLEAALVRQAEGT